VPDGSAPAPTAVGAAMAVAVVLLLLTPSLLRFALLPRLVGAGPLLRIAALASEAGSDAADAAASALEAASEAGTAAAANASVDGVTMALAPRLAAASAPPPQAVSAIDSRSQDRRGRGQGRMAAAHECADRQRRDSAQARRQGM